MKSPFYFQGTMDYETLCRYVSRAVTHQTLCVDDPIFEEDLRLIASVGAKFIGRAAHFSWDGHLTAAQVEEHFRKAAEGAAAAHRVDPELILQAGVFEIIYRDTVNALKIPAHAFAAFGLPPEERRFCWEDMLFPEDFDFGDTPWDKWGGRDFWNEGAAWPFIGNLETQLYVYTVICRYIDSGFEAVHLGQAEKSAGKNTQYYDGWDRVTTLARAYAKAHARRGVVLFDCHTVIDGGDMKIGDRLILDIVGAGMVPTDTVKEDGVLKCRLSDCADLWCTWLGRSPGGVHPLGFTVETCPTIIELDNYGRPGPAGEYNEIYSPWGYDDITWFALQPAWYRDAFLLECDDLLKTTRLDSRGRPVYFLQPQLRRNLCLDGDDPTCRYVPGPAFDPAYFKRYTEAEGIGVADNGDGSYTLTTSEQYRANNPSDRCPNGFGQEETIRRIFAAEFPASETKETMG